METIKNGKKAFLNVSFHGQFIPVISAVTLCMGAFLFIIGLSVHMGNERLSVLADRQRGLCDHQEKILNSLLVFSKFRTWETLNLAVEAASDDLSGDMGRLKGNLSIIGEVLLINRILFCAGILVAALSVALPGILIIRRARRLSLSVDSLRERIETVAAGGYGETGTCAGGDELSILVRPFGRMVRAVREREERLKTGMRLARKRNVRKGRRGMKPGKDKYKAAAIFPVRDEGGNGRRQAT